MNKTATTNIETGERTIRTIVTAGLIGSVFTQTGDLGTLSLLPLLAIYTGITALTGWDPIAAAIDSFSQSRHERRYRIGGTVSAS